MASDLSPQDRDELHKLRRENERLRSRLDFEKQQRKQELEFQHSQDVKELEFERQQSETLESTLLQQLSVLKAERDGIGHELQQLRDVVQQLQDDKRGLQDKNECLQDENEQLQDEQDKMRLANTMLQEKITVLEGRIPLEGRSQDSPPSHPATAPINPPPNSQPTSSYPPNKNRGPNVPNSEKLTTDNAKSHTFKLTAGLPSPATPMSASQESDDDQSRQSRSDSKEVFFFPAHPKVFALEDTGNSVEDCKPTITSTPTLQPKLRNPFMLFESLTPPKLTSKESQIVNSSPRMSSSPENPQDDGPGRGEDGVECVSNKPEGEGQDAHENETMDVDEATNSPAVHVPKADTTAPSIDVCRLALSHLDNPEVKGPAFNELPADVMYTRMVSMGLATLPLDIHADILHQVFTRAHLSNVHGGSPMQTFPNVNKTLASRHGYERFMCVNLDFNPFAPRKPGAPGLYFALRDPNLWPRPNEIVISALGVGRWNVMGKYEIKQSTPLSGQEFQQMPRRVQNAWTNSIYKYDWGLFTLANIYLRRIHGRDPTKEEVESKLKGTSKPFFAANVNESEIREAFMEGRERVNVWTMICVGYDGPFKRALIAPQRAGTTTDQPGRGLDELSRTKSAKKNAGASSASKTTAGQKRRRSSSSSGGSEEDDDTHSDGSDASGDVYLSRGTRSRPN